MNSTNAIAAAKPIRHQRKPSSYMSSTSDVVPVPRWRRQLSTRWPDEDGYTVVGRWPLRVSPAKITQTEMEILGSRAVVSAVVDSLHLQARVLEPWSTPLSEILLEGEYPEDTDLVELEFERAGDRLFNAALLVDPDGRVLLHHRKIHYVFCAGVLSAMRGLGDLVTYLGTAVTMGVALGGADWVAFSIGVFVAFLPMQVVLVRRQDVRPEQLHLLGTPEQVTQKLRLYEQAGVDLFCYGVNVGLPWSDLVRSLELFIEKVMPAFADSRPAGKRQQAVSS